jgi:hypothetical protein
MYFKTLDDLKIYVSGTCFSYSDQLMIMVGEKSADRMPEMFDYLNRHNVNFSGGIFPEIIVGNKNRKEGYVVEKIQPLYSSIVFPFMMRSPQDKEKLRGATAIIFADGLSGSMEDLVETVHEKLGDTVTYIGGGAGFYDMHHRPCIFDNSRLYADALWVCIISNEARTALEHGWSKMSGPFYAKGSYDNVLSQLDSYKAFDIYRSVIEEEEDLTLFKEDFFIYAKDHPFGIYTDDGSLIVRDPVAVNDDDEIICVAGIPEDSEVYILKGDTDTLLKSSLRIAQTCRDCAPQKYLPLLFDCISRAMFLGKRFSDEIDNIQANLNYGIEGALSIGEIATGNNGGPVIHNKSTVLALIEL